jgi:hypothetical protein
VRYSGTPIWQDVASPCVTLPDYGMQVPAIPDWTVGGCELERAFLWGSLQAEWARLGFILCPDGRLKAKGRLIEVVTPSGA